MRAHVHEHKLHQIFENADMQLPQKRTVLNRHNVGKMLLTPDTLMQSAIKFNINEN